jgi:lipopolysaccharide transport system permease protein
MRTNVTSIRPAGRWVSLDVAELWRYRELLYFLTWRDVKIRYKQTAIGIAWAVLQPLITTAIFTLLFSSFARFDTGSVPYPLFALSGLLVWLFVHTSVTMASASLTTSSNLVTKVYFPRMIMPLAAALAALLDLAIGLLILAVMMVWYGIVPGPSLVLAPVFVAAAFVLAASLGICFAALNVRFRDVRFALPFLLQVWMIASPIFYPSAIVSGGWRYLFAANPLTGILEGFRSSVFGTPFDWDAIGISAVSLAVITLASIIIFKRMEDDFADLI